MSEGTAAGSGASVDVAVVGAGIIGCAVSWALTKAGRRVLLIDRADPATAGASFGNVGHIATEQLQPLPSPQLLFNFWRELVAFGGVLDIPLRRVVAMTPWMARFALAAFRLEVNARHLAPLVSNAANMLETQLLEVGRGDLIRRNGHYALWLGRHATVRAAAERARASSIGVPTADAPIELLRAAAAIAEAPRANQAPRSAASTPNAREPGADPMPRPATSMGNAGEPGANPMPRPAASMPSAGELGANPMPRPAASMPNAGEPGANPMPPSTALAANVEVAGATGNTLSGVTPAGRIARTEGARPGVKMSAAGVWYPGTAHVLDPAHVARAFATACAQGSGSIVRAEVRHVRPCGDNRVEIVTGNGTFTPRTTIICAGAWSPPLLAPFGINAPIEAERGYHIELPNHAPLIDAPILYADHSVVVTPMASRLRASTFLEFAGLGTPADPDKPRRLRAKVRQMGYDCSPEGSSWMGPRPTLPDYLPGIGRAPGPHELYYAVGHQHLGLTLSAVTADLVAALVMGHTPRFSVEAFDLKRFGSL